MKTLRNPLFALAVLAAFGGAAWAQMGRGMMGGGPPNIPGVFSPKAGEGAEYQITSKQGPMNFEFAIVGKETVDGQDGYWQEIRMKGGKADGMVMKQLMVVGGSGAGIKRMIMQQPGQQAMEMPMGMMNSMMGSMMRQQATPQSSAKTPADLGEMVGTESITVPAGTFECEHYKSKSAEGGDLWVSSKVSPYGLIKAVTKDSTIVLQKTLSNQTSQIKGEVKKMEMEMPHF